MRAYSHRNNNPTYQAFKQIFRSLLIARLINFHSERYNCEDVTGEQILRLQNLMQTVLGDDGKEINLEPQDLSLPSSSIKRTLPPVHTKKIQAEVRKERLNVH
ncbi:hypothetical protein K1T71_000239 [Dendrolimus kikuchii]|uniref:Uncharacterized protein n=1 Tax=Dendrolimus kikuchii TaxID=765133 RepID=A0ACC1DJ11_9NEOP|nr:hypothetical protein K1T71_000239 [Dendrolimus kikuchii]